MEYQTSQRTTYYILHCVMFRFSTFSISIALVLASQVPYAASQVKKLKRLRTLEGIHKELNPQGILEFGEIKRAPSVEKSKPNAGKPIDLETSEFGRTKITQSDKEAKPNVGARKPIKSDTPKIGQSKRTQSVKEARPNLHQKNRNYQKKKTLKNAKTALKKEAEVIVMNSEFSYDFDNYYDDDDFSGIYDYDDDYVSNFFDDDDDDYVMSRPNGGVNSMELRCGASQPDARCGKICRWGADCDSHQWCWIVHENSCPSLEVSNREMMFKTIQD